MLGRCWLHETSLYYGLYPVIGVVLTANITILVVVSLKIRKTIAKNSDKPNLAALRRTALLSSILGIVWILGAILVISDHNQVLQVIFACIVPLQGVFIFLFHGLGNKEIRRTWCSGLTTLTKPLTCMKSVKVSSLSYGKDSRIEYSDVSFRRRAWISKQQLPLATIERQSGDDILEVKKNSLPE